MKQLGRCPEGLGAFSAAAAHGSISRRCLGGFRVGDSLASGGQHGAQSRQDVPEGGPLGRFGGPAGLHQRAVVGQHVRRHFRLEAGKHLEQNLRTCPDRKDY